MSSYQHWLAPRRLVRVVASLSLLFAVGTRSRPAEASEEVEESASFDELVKRAKKSFSEGEYDLAVEQLRLAHSRRDHPRLLFNIARSFDKSGDCERALVYYQSFLNRDDIENALEKRAKKALGKSDECDTYTGDNAGRLVLRSEPSGATVSVDGDRVGKTPTEVAGLETGEQRVTFELEGHETRELTVSVKPATDRTVDETLEEVSDETAEEDQEGEDSEEAKEDESIRDELVEESDGGGGFEPRTGPMVLAGAGVAVLGVSAVVNWVTLPNIDAKRRQLLPQRDQSLERKRDTYEAVLIGTVGGGLAMVGGAAVWQFAVQPSDSKSGTAREETSGAETKVGVCSAPSCFGPRVEVRF